MTLILAIVPVLLLIVLMAFLKCRVTKVASSPDSNYTDSSFRIPLCGRQLGIFIRIRCTESGFSHPDYHPDGYLQLQCIAENREDGDYQTTILFHLYR